MQSNIDYNAATIGGLRSRYQRLEASGKLKVQMATAVALELTGLNSV
jgi:hypothetical protein